MRYQIDPRQRLLPLRANCSATALPHATVLTPADPNGGYGAQRVVRGPQGHR